MFLEEIHLRQNGARGESITRMFQDQALFWRIGDVRRCLAPKRLRPLCDAMQTHERTRAHAAVNAATGALPHGIATYRHEAIAAKAADGPFFTAMLDDIEFVGATEVATRCGHIVRSTSAARIDRSDHDSDHLCAYLMNLHRTHGR